MAAVRPGRVDRCRTGDRGDADVHRAHHGRTAAVSRPCRSCARCWLSLALLLAGGAALSAATDQLPGLHDRDRPAARGARHPIAVPPVALKLQSGARIDIADLRGKWLLVDFIYTRCTTYCRALGSEFAQLQQRLAGPLGEGAGATLSISLTRPRHAGRARRLPAALANRGAGWAAARPVGADALPRARARVWHHRDCRSAGRLHPQRRDPRRRPAGPADRNRRPRRDHRAGQVVLQPHERGLAMSVLGAMT